MLAAEEISLAITRGGYTLPLHRLLVIALEDIGTSALGAAHLLRRWLREAGFETINLADRPTWHN